MESTAVFNNNKIEKPSTISKVRSVLLGVTLVHHTCVLIATIIANSIDMSQMSAELRKKLSNHLDMTLTFLTTWNFLSQWVYIVIELALIYLPSANHSKLLEKLNWFHFLTVVWPTTLYIMTLFWGLYNVDRELIFPRHLDILLPPHLNHSMHTVIAVLLILETLTTQKDYLPAMALLMKINLVYMLAYCFVLNYTFLSKGLWAYPFLYYMTEPQRCLLYLASIAATQLFLQSGYFIVGIRCRAISLITKPLMKST